MTYKDLLLDIRKNGVLQEYRNGNRISVFGKSLEYDLEERFPLVQDKKTAWFDGLVDLIWMIRGSSDVSMLDELGIKYNFWKRWAVDGTIGNLYGRAWRHSPNNGTSMYPDDVILSGAHCPDDVEFGEEYINSTKTEVDQLANLIYGLRNHAI